MARLSPAFSAYLDGSRLFAALVVFAHHASYSAFDGGWIAPLGGYGHEAVMIFFVLSGYVITHVVDSRERDLGEYVISRLSRLWSVALPAIAVTWLMDAVGRAIAPQIYDVPSLTVASALVSVPFLNEIWFAEITPGSNIPYWSLSYEFVYYVLFAAFTFLPHRPVVLALVALAAGPKILLLLPAWACGSVAYRFSARPLTKRAAYALAAGGGVVAACLAVSKAGNLYVTWRWAHVIGSRGLELMGHSSAFISDNLIALAFAAHLVGLAHLLGNARLPPKIAQAIQQISAATFPIYLLHYPSLYFFTAVSIGLAGARKGILIGLASLSIGVMLTPATERLKHLLRHALKAIACLGGTTDPPIIGQRKAETRGVKRPP